MVSQKLIMLPLRPLYICSRNHDTLWPCIINGFAVWALLYTKERALYTNSIWIIPTIKHIRPSLAFSLTSTINLTNKISAICHKNYSICNFFQIHNQWYIFLWHTTQILLVKFKVKFWHKIWRGSINQERDSIILIFVLIVYL